MISLAALLMVTVWRLGAPGVAELPNACSLLDRDDVAAVQGEPYVETKLTSGSKVSRCFYQLPTFTASVSLEVIEDPKQAFWEAHFEGSSSRGRERSEEEKEEREELTPTRVSGVGDEAFWIGNVAGATLWVRSDGLALRVSVGGTGTQADKLERSKRIAAKALEKIANASRDRSGG